jgi:hypothetical protein
VDATSQVAELKLFMLGLVVTLHRADRLPFSTDIKYVQCTFDSTI